MRGKETLWKQIRTLWTGLLLAVLFVGAVQVKAEGNPEEGTTQGEVQAPTITITPYIDGERYTVGYLPLDINSKHTLSVQAVASDGSTPTYVWKDKDGKPIESESTNVLEITKGIGNESYSVEVTTESGGFESCSFFLDPEETLQVTQWIGEEQTSHAACQVGESVTFRVQAESSYEGHVLTYQWKDGNGHNIETANGEKYTITKGKIGEECYACEVSDGNYIGCYTFSVDSGETLTISKLLINNQEYRQWDYFACTEDGPYTLKVEAVTSLDNIQYQWYGRNEIGSHAPIDGATGPELTVDRPTGSELYYCWISDGNKNETANFYLDLGDTLTIKGMTINGQEYEQWDYFACTEDGPYTLKVEATTSMDKIDYQWYEENEAGPDELIVGATRPEITVDRPSGSKDYYCQISDGNKSKNANFHLNLGDTLSVKQYVDGDLYREYTTLECTENETVQLEVRAESSLGAEKITYDWYYYNEKGENTPVGNGSAICKYPMQAGYHQIYCTVDDGNENETYYFYLTTAPTLSVEQYMNGHKGTNTDEFVKGEPITLEVKAKTTSGNNITYQWYNATWCDESAKLSEAKDAVLNIKKDEASDNGYCCKVSDGIFTEECQFYINSKNTLSIRGLINDGSDNADVSFTEGEEISLGVEATSSYDNDHIKYKWFKEVDGEMTELDTEESTVNVVKGSGTEYYECEVDDGNAKSTYGFYLYEDAERTPVTCIPYIDGERYDSYFAGKYDCTIGQTLTLRAEVLTEEDNVSRVWEYYDKNQGEWVKQSEEGESLSVKIASEYDKYRCIITVGGEEDTLYYDLYAQNTGGGDEPGEEENTYLVPYVNGQESSEITDGIGETVNLSVEVVNPPENVAYQWYKDRGNSDIAIKGANEDSYTYTIEEGVESISCRVYTDSDSTFYMTFDIASAYEEEESTLTFTQYINDAVGDYIEYTPGKELTLKVEAKSSVGDVSYTWYDNNGTKLGEGQTYKFTLTGDEYIQCQMFDGESYKDAWFELNVLSTWSATQYIDGEEAEEKVCAQNDSVKLEMRVTGEPAGTLTYKWYDNKNKLQGTNPVLPVTAGTKAEMYRCVVSDGYQTEEYEFYLKPEGDIIVTLRINGEKADEISLDAGETAELKVEVGGTTEKVSYQWYVSKNEEVFKPLGTSESQKIVGDTSDIEYLCAVRVGAVEKRVYFYVYGEGGEGEHVHHWDSGIITKEPTQTETGIKTYTCLSCGEKRQEVLDKLPPTTEDIKPSNPTTETKPSTQPSQQTPSASTASPAPAIGATLVASDKKTVYKVTGSNTVEYKKAGSNKAKVTIPSTVTYQGRKYQVTSIGTKAFKNNKKLKKVVIPSTVRKIGKQAFINCKKLKSITIKTNKLNAKAIGSKAFKGINAKATIKVPKKKLKLYKKILRAKGVSASVRIK